MGNIYAKLDAMFDKYEVQCAVDSGFGKIERDCMVKSTQDYLTSSLFHLYPYHPYHFVERRFFSRLDLLVPL